MFSFRSTIDLYIYRVAERKAIQAGRITRLLKKCAVDCILNIEKTSNLFVMLLSEIGLSSDDLYIKYVVKNQLNSFRQNNGYKDGSYIKIWGMVEDNVIALSIMTDNPEFTPSQLYKELERKYNKLKQPTTEEDR